MADVVLDFQSQLGKRLVVAVGLEDGVVAETFTTPAFTDDLPFDDSLEAVYLLDASAATGTDIAFLNQRNYSTETCTTIVVVP